MLKKYKPDQQLHQILTLITRFQKEDPAMQIQRLENVMKLSGLSATPAQIPEMLSQVLERQKRFKRLPKFDQLRYMVHVYNWRRNAPHPSATEQATRAETRNIMMMFPLISAFAQRNGGGDYNEGRDGNWYLWWARKSPDLRMKDGETRRTVKDRQLLHHLLLPSPAPKPHSPLSPSGANTKLDISKRSSNRPWE